MKPTDKRGSTDPHAGQASHFAPEASASSSGFPVADAATNYIAEHLEQIMTLIEYYGGPMDPRLVPVLQRFVFETCITFAEWGRTRQIEIAAREKP